MNKKILESINIDFNKEQTELVISELLSIKLNHVMANSEYNLNNTQFAILKLSKGDLNKVIEFTKSAKIDFRDVIMWALEKPDKQKN